MVIRALRDDDVTAPIEPLGGRTAFDGHAFSVRVERFRHADGEIAEREIVRRRDAAAVVAYDDQHVWLVRQPREALLAHTLELPAGVLDDADGGPLQAAQRELREEIGRSAEHWRRLFTCYASSGYSDEQVHLFAATGLREVGAEPDPGERIEIVEWPRDDLAAAIAECRDAKTIIGLQWLAELGASA